MSSTFLVTSSDEFEGAARNELRKYDPKLKTLESLVAGLFLIQTNFAEDDFAAIVAQQPPIYVRHFFPVQATVTLTKSAADLDTLSQTVADLPALTGLVPDMTFGIQARLAEEADGQASSYPYTPFAIKERLANVIAEKSGASENIRQPQMVLSVVCVKNRAYLGLSLTELNLSDWAGGMRRFAKRPEQISRAELKLQEALEIFGVTLPNAGLALDLGAAPGGWTRLLLEAGLAVIAVDPATLDPRLDHFGGKLTHYQGYAERFLDENKTRRGEFVLIASDLRMDAVMAARLVVSYAPLLSRTGFAITTLKLPHETPSVKPANLAEQALNILRPAFKEVRARQLFHNRQEITVFLRAK